MALSRGPWIPRPRLRQRFWGVWSLGLRVYKELFGFTVKSFGLRVGLRVRRFGLGFRAEGLGQRAKPSKPRQKKRQQNAEENHGLLPLKDSTP